MPLAAGVRLGVYEILSPLGAGGMGEVYKARDTRLDRTVAIKVLPDALTEDRRFRERFNREARAISRLTHPRICTLHDVGEQNGTAFLVMEYLQGETLADRLARGALPIDEALAIGAHIADALAHAHRAGIVHRDLKPGNVILTRSGAKLLDFGLAKSGPPIMAEAAASMLPTTPQNITERGTILGTFQYMSPEQLEGADADARTDIFAFGDVLYEMLTGRKAFAARTHAGLVSAIMSAAPELPSATQPSIPPSLDRVVARCLQKNPDERWQSAVDLAAELGWIAEDRTRGPQPARTGASRASPAAAGARVWMSAAVLAMLTTAAFGVALWRRPVVPVAVTRFVVPPPPNARFLNVPGLLAVSPDGRQISYLTRGIERRGRNLINLHSLATGASTPMRINEDAYHPFWSPDGRSIGYAAGAALKRLDLASGTTRILAESTAGERGAWGTQGVLLFQGTDGRLYRLSQDGGPAAPVTALDTGRGETQHAWPVFLPDGRRFVYQVRSSKPENRGLFLASLDAPGRTLLVDAFSSVEYAAGYLFYQRQGTLLAHKLDDSAGRLVGEPIRIADNVEFNAINGRGAFAVSQTGTVVYREGSNEAKRPLTWFDGAGRPAGSIGDVATAAAFPWERLSPDGQRVATAQNEGAADQIWLLDIPRRVFSKFTVGISHTAPVWSPDGRWLAFGGSNQNGTVDLYRKPIDGGPDELLLASPDPKWPTDWSPDGRHLLFTQSLGGGQVHIFALPLQGDRKPFAVVQSAGEDEFAAFSPNGRWIAYESEASAVGDDQIYIQPFPATGARWQVSTDGGFYPRWGRDGKMLYFLSKDLGMMAVTVDTAGAEFHAGPPRELFQAPLDGLSSFFEPSRDGRFLMLSQSTIARDAPLSVIVNWTAAGGR